MKRLGLWLAPSVVVLGVIGLVFWAAPAFAGNPNTMTNADYSGTPPFVATSVQPNVLILMDNSGSMGFRAYCADGTNKNRPYTNLDVLGHSATTGNDQPCPAGSNFSESTAYSGLFDSLSCYTYDATNSRFVPDTNADGTALQKTPLSVSTACAATKWDGNFLNWVTFRRIDALKKALIGGTCAATRASDGTCPASGSPAWITIKANDQFTSTCCSDNSTPPVPAGGCGTGCGDHRANGRVPTAVQTLGASPVNLVFHNRSTGSLDGSFCVASDADDRPSSGDSSCSSNASGGFTEQKFVIHVAVITELAGVIQDLGDKARFGLLEFRNSLDGGKILVPMGSVQATAYSSSSVSNYTSNKAAMVFAVDQSNPASSTPLSETLYSGVRYIAQLPNPFGASGYFYPLAYSPGPSFSSSASQAMGTIGPELSYLATGDTCPAGYITNACGRDPFFFTSANPVWASVARQVACCKTFIMIITDGAPTNDVNIPTAIQDLAHSAHGLHCTGGDPVIHAPNGTCNTNEATPPATILGEHKTDRPGSGSHYLDDVAYWAHTTDLRQATVPVINEAGHDIPGFQNVTVYALFAFGNINGREILMQAAKQGGFSDQNGNNLPDQHAEWDLVDNATGLLVPDNVPDTYFESSNADDMEDKLRNAITGMLQHAASGTTVSVLATASTGEGAIYQAYFFPLTFVDIGSTTNQVAWTGYAQGLFIDRFGNLREDYSASGCTGSPDGKLVLTHDCIVKVRLETDPASPNYNSVVVDRFKDDGSATGSTAGDGIADTTTPFQTVALSSSGVSNVQPMWEGGRRLALLSPGTTCESSNSWPKSGVMSQGGSTCRRILTWADIDNNGSVTSGDVTSGSVTSPEALEVSTANAATLCPYLGAKVVIYCNSTNAAAITNADVSAGGDSVLLGMTNCVTLTRKVCAQNEATNIIKWIRGEAVSGLRVRTFNVVNDAGSIVQAQWKLGDVIDSAPVVLGAPRERFDVIYGDATYAQFFQRYKDRRNVAYIGANDGMLHAFNAGFFLTEGAQIDGTGPTVQVRFTTTPKQPHTSTNCSGLPCDAAVTQYSFRTDAPPLGAELWAFIPQDLLPQLRWLTTANYDHTYYVDLAPKVTDVRIFCNDQVTIANCVQGTNADHPGGWGTVLIGGFRLGGSCSACTSGKGTPRVVQADFNYDGDTTDTGDGASGGSSKNSDYRVFLSSYFVLDITNPEKEPTLLWVFRDDDLGLTTASPAVLRVNPSGDAKTSSTNEKWYVVFGTGPTHHDGFSTQGAQTFVVDLKLGPVYSDINKTTGGAKSKGKKAGQPCPTTLPCMSSDSGVGSRAVRVFDTGVNSAFMGDAVTVDFNLDFRTEVVYAGSMICNGTATSTGCPGTGPVWKGAVWRLTTNSGDTDPDNWGIVSGSNRAPAKLISTFAVAVSSSTCTNSSSATTCNVGPISTAPALTLDDTHNLWLFFGTGRLYSAGDKGSLGVDIQHFFGVKDSFMTLGSPAQTTERNNLFNSSNVVTCATCASGGNVSTSGSTTSFTTGFSSGSGNLMSQINGDGWFTTFNDCSTGSCALTQGERNLSSSTLIGGTVFFTTFVPQGDMCLGAGTGQLYAVYFLTGGPYTASAIGTVTSGSDKLARKSISLGQGLPSQMAIQIGAQGTGAEGTASSAGCSGRVTGFIQSSTGVLGQTCGAPALPVWSRMVSWRDL